MEQGSDDSLQLIEGSYEQCVGNVQERYGQKQHERMKWADRWHQQSQAEARKEKTR